MIPRPIAQLRLVILSAALAAGASAEPVPRTVLVESFGSVDCADCPDVRTAMTAIETDPGVVALEYHTEGPLASPGSVDRSDYYGTPALPTAIFDGIDVVAGGGDLAGTYRSRVETLQGAGSPLLIDATYNFTGVALAGTLNVRIEVATDQSVSAPWEYAVRGVLLESDVVECCGPGGESSWSRVVRRLLPDEPLETAVPGQVQFFRHVFTLEPHWDNLQLGVAVFVQHEADRHVLQAQAAGDAGSLQPIPWNGLDDSLVTLSPSFPNPVRVEARILFTLPRPQEATLTVYDARGRLVRTLTAGPRTGGVHNVFWDGSDYRGARAATGIYVYQLVAEDGVLSEKLTLLR